jgi:ABC-type sugar transport system substrate-binding protein
MTHVVVLKKVTSGTEASRLLAEATRWADGVPGAGFIRRDENTLELTVTGDIDLAAAQRLVEDALAAANPTWSIHVARLTP